MGKDSFPGNSVSISTSSSPSLSPSNNSEVLSLVVEKNGGKVEQKLKRGKAHGSCIFDRGRGLHYSLL